jgi:hypothetical protein
MARTKIPQENKKKNLFLAIDSNLFEKLDKLDIKNKSKFVSWLLEKHFNNLNKKEN